MKRFAWQQKQVFITVLSSLTGAVVTSLITAHVVFAQVSPSVVHACVDSVGALSLIKPNNSCKPGETPITLATGGSSGGGEQYFGLPFIASYTDLSPVADKLAGQDFSGALLFNNVFRDADVQGVIFANATLNSIHFQSSNFSQANFENTRLVGSTFLSSNFSSANFTAADLSDIEFRSQEGVPTDLTNANFTNANLSRAIDMESNSIRTGAIWNNTICPDMTNSNDNGGTCEGHIVYLEE